MPAKSQRKRPASQQKRSARSHRIVQQSWWRSSTTLLWASVLGIVLSANILVLSGLYLWQRQTRLSFALSPSVTAPLHLRAAEPIQVEVPQLKINLPIIPSQIHDGVWETSPDKATHLDQSARPNEGGNIIIYAHNLKKMFGPLRAAKVGESILISTIDGKRFEYVIQEIKIVKPSEVEVVQPTDHEVLTMYTCTGFLDSQRLVVRATLKSVSQEN